MGLSGMLTVFGGEGEGPRVARALPVMMVVGVLGLAGVGLTTLRGAAESPSIPAPDLDEAAGSRASEVAVLAGGCFWGVQGVFQHVDGVGRAVSGYAGGTEGTAHYDTVSSGATGHAESVEVTFDPRNVSYGTLLQIYFSVAHDPTQLNRQGPDFGTQYRSAIFPTSAEQERIARAYIAQLEKARVFGGPIVTTIEPGATFHPAEAHHQDFLTLHPTHPYIVINDLPKVAALERLFPRLYRQKPVRVGAARTGG
jgi:peptide-methionine (S)-S-oxide reductase